MSTQYPLVIPSCQAYSTFECLLFMARRQTALIAGEIYNISYYIKIYVALYLTYVGIDIKLDLIDN